MVIFADGFDPHGDFSLWTGTTTSGGATATVVNTPQHHGTYSGQFYAPAGGQSYDSKDLGSGYAACNVRAYVRFNVLPTSSDEALVFFRALDSGTSSIYWCALVKDGADYKIQIHEYKPGVLNVFSAALSPAPTTNTWYCLEVGFVRDASGGYRAYWAGTEVVTSTGLDTRGVNTGLQTIAVGAYYAILATTANVDCVVVDSSYIGPEPTVKKGSSAASAMMGALVSGRLYG